jgi:hypothetical protein
VLVGQLYAELGLGSLLLLVVPVLMARRTYRAALELHDAEEATIAVFLRALAAKDPSTADRAERVAELATGVAGALALARDRATALRRAALLHDIGTLGVPAELLRAGVESRPEAARRRQRAMDQCVSVLGRVAFLRVAVIGAAGGVSGRGAGRSLITTTGGGRSSPSGGSARTGRTVRRSAKSGRSAAVTDEEILEVARAFAQGATIAQLRAAELRYSRRCVEALATISGAPAAGAGAAPISGVGPARGAAVSERMPPERDIMV